MTDKFKTLSSFWGQPCHHFGDEIMGACHHFSDGLSSFLGRFEQFSASYCHHFGDILNNHTSKTKCKFQAFLIVENGQVRKPKAIKCRMVEPTAQVSLSSVAKAERSMRTSVFFFGSLSLPRVVTGRNTIRCGIRTHETPKGSPEYQSGAIDHSANLPYRLAAESHKSHNLRELVNPVGYIFLVPMAFALMGGGTAGGTVSFSLRKKLGETMNKFLRSSFYEKTKDFAPRIIVGAVFLCVLEVIHG